MGESRQDRSVDWGEVVRKVRSHPGGVVAGCRALGVREGQYYYHQRRIKSVDREPQTFKEIVPPLGFGSEVEIRLRNGRSILLRGEVSVSQLSPLISMVEGE